MLPSIVVSLLAGMVSVGWASPYLEEWSTNPPGNNSWYFYGATDTEHPAGDWPMEWVSSGGQSGAYVRTDLGQTVQWPYTPGTFYAAYSYETGQPTGHTSHPLNLVDYPVIEVYLKEAAPPTHLAQLNLRGGTIRFWVGEWIDADGQGGPESYAFYYFNPQELQHGEDDWRFNRLWLTSRPEDWTLLGTGLNPRPVNSILPDPQQWGFGVVGSGAAPSGVLGFDTFHNTVPEPAAVALVLFAGLGLLRRQHARTRAGR